jgi:uncharacterized membrane protein
MTLSGEILMPEPASGNVEMERLRQSIEAMERRLTLLEKRIGPHEALPERAEHAVEHQALPVAAASAVSPWTDHPPRLADQLLPSRLRPPPLPKAPTVERESHPPPEGPRPARPQRKPGRSIEAVIGQNWASWIGAIVLFLGIVFFLRYAWDRGWIRPAPEVRVAAAVAAGFVLAGLGEWGHRRHLRSLAGSLYGAGAAVVIASLFGAHVYFDPPVLQRNASFIGVALAASLAIAASLRIHGMAVALIALIGAYLAPVMLSSGRDESGFWLAYFAALAAAGWALSHFKPRWLPLRWLVLVCSYLSLCGWWAAMGDRHDHHTLGLTWTSIFYTGFVLEAVLTLNRRSQASQAVGGDEDYLLPSVSVPRLDASIALTSLLATAWTVTLYFWVLGQQSLHMLGVLSIVLAGVQMAAGLVTRSRAYRVSSILQASALITLAVPLLLDNLAITLAWTAMAAVLGILAWQLNLRAVRWWAAALLGLAVLRLVFFDQFNPGLVTPQVMIFAQPVSHWLLIACTIAVLFHLLAWLSPRATGETVIDAFSSSRGPADESFSRAKPLSYAAAPAAGKPAWSVTGIDAPGVIFAIIGTAVFAAAVSMDWSGPMFTLSLVGWVLPIVLLGRCRQAEAIHYASHAAILALLVSVLWLWLDNLLPLLHAWRRGETPPPLLNLQSIGGLILATAVVRIGSNSRWLQSRRLPDSDTLEPHAVFMAWAVVLLFALLNFETWRTVDWLQQAGIVQIVDRAIVKQVSMSMLWALLAFAGIVFGFWREVVTVRWAALGLLGITLVKILVIDMAEVSAIWRILSFLAVGALLLAVSFVYHRQVQARVAAEC